MTNLIQIPLSAREFGRWMGQRGLQDLDTGLHTFVTGLFGRSVLQPYRYFESRGEDAALIYGYAISTAEELNDMVAITATPGMEDVLTGEIRSKVMPRLSRGQRIGFDLRTIPTRRRDGRERDAHAIDLDMERGRTREESYHAWLAERLAGCAEIEQSRVSRFEKMRTRRKGTKITVPSINMQGTVSVTDPEAFSALLLAGIGRHKAYGYGQMLLRPADPQPVM